MTDNTPRPEPMSRESVLAVMRLPVGLVKARAAVIALYNERDALKRAMDERNKGAWLDGQRYRCKICGTGTEPSDAEGGG